ncbi:hypothetical protein CFP56_008010 [Quercus suber]|uniref:Ribosomal protein S14 n=1 Tax=Quercus suber TaxID=58331 RepID=A0AAW0L491_QUESU
MPVFGLHLVSILKEKREIFERHRGERKTSQGRHYRRPPTTRKIYFFCRRTTRAVIGSLAYLAEFQ